MFGYFKAQARPYVVAFALAITGLASASAATGSAPPSLTPAVHHARTIKLINYFIERYHYQKVRLDDALSSQILNRYLEALDNNRVYFLASDIEGFEQYRFKLDDALGDNETGPFFEIFNVYRTRVIDRLRFAATRLQEPFDFSIDEEYPFDRTESPYAIDTAELDDLWRRRVKNDVLTLRLEDKADDEIRTTLGDRYAQQVRRTVQVTPQDVFQTLVNAYMTSIEPHTGYFSPRATENFKIRMSLSLEGIGAVLQTQNEFTVVQRIVPGGPAEIDGGLRAGDRIVGVGQEDGSTIIDVIGWRLDDVVDLIRGPKGTVVRLQVRPDPKSGDSETRVLAITRDQIKLEEQAAQKSVLEVKDGGVIHRVGVIDIPTFYVDFDGKARGEADFRSTTADVRRLIGELEKDRVDGLIIDLRGNGGGALSEATALTGLFIPSGPVVQVRDARGRTRVNRDPDDDLAYDGPLAVIVDRDSASASEIFSGAIQDYRRGIIVGETTFGKGTVQNLIDLDRYSDDPNQPLGQLKLTIAQFFRVSGASTQHRGVTPDIVLPSPQVTEEYGERALDNALPWKQIDATDFDIYAERSRTGDLQNLRELTEKRLLVDPDFAYLNGLRSLDLPLAVATRISLMESKRKNERDERLREQSTLLNELKQAYAIPDDADSSLPRDAILIESARVLSDLAFGHFDGRLIVESTERVDRPDASPSTQ